jgi:hypothetical protein
MNHRLYCSSGNDLGIAEFVSYSELGDDGRWIRYVEIKADGTALRYSEALPADRHGVLPEGRWDETEASKPEYGTVTAISAELFEAVWTTTLCTNAR